MSNTQKLNHLLELKATKGVSLNAQLAEHPEFHSPDITDCLLDYLKIDPWGTHRTDTQNLLGLDDSQASAQFVALFSKNRK